MQVSVKLIRFHNYTEILEVNLFAFACRLHGPLDGTMELREIFMKQSVGKCK